jgi:hypothetical protein
MGHGTLREAIRKIRRPSYPKAQNYAGIEKILTELDSRENSCVLVGTQVRSGTQLALPSAWPCHSFTSDRCVSRTSFSPLAGGATGCHWVPRVPPFCPGLAGFGNRNSVKSLIIQGGPVNSHAGGHRFETGRSHRTENKLAR